ncbi:RecX family transcriptional regulator [Sphingomonas sp.]|jgi:regulatory protein|uniref:RecX family transcriptional regulator n=1 Tax=Sphingomonas sp. TaxID=28214 RepID=UPI002D80D42C|nr:RecX family transcriptional regulator [Sphingomonas sp.]HEU0044294.1 RecX family transcriptional regulator [Sphingomonas sp.]
MNRERRPPPPLDGAALERLALRYVERFATTRGKLTDYLRRKVRERGWEGEPAEPVAMAERMAELGYIDDLAFAQAKAAALGRRGLGARRVSGALIQARVEEADRDTVAPEVAGRAIEAALAFARRKRLGPWARVEVDRAGRDKQLAAMLRAGHPLDLSRRILALPQGVEPSADELG